MSHPHITLIIHNEQFLKNQTMLCRNCSLKYRYFSNPTGTITLEKLNDNSNCYMFGGTATKVRFPLPELTGDRFPLPINTGHVKGRVFPLAGGRRPVNSASGNVRPSTRPVLTGNGNRSPVNSGRGNRA